jgi:hypothetical protein
MAKRKVAKLEVRVVRYMGWLRAFARDHEEGGLYLSYVAKTSDEAIAALERDVKAQIVLYGKRVRTLRKFQALIEDEKAKRAEAKIRRAEKRGSRG